MFSGTLRRLGEEAKVSFLLIWVGEKGRDIRNTWTLSDKEGKRLQTFYCKFEAYVTPKSNEVFACYKFQARVQAEGEPFENFVTDLKLLVKDCSYPEDEKWFVIVLCLVCNPNIRKKLINKGNELTLDSAIEMAQTL